MGLRLRKIRRDYRLEREDFGKFFFPPVRKWSMDRYEMEMTYLILSVLFSMPI